MLLYGLYTIIRASRNIGTFAILVWRNIFFINFYKHVWSGTKTSKWTVTRKTGTQSENSRDPVYNSVLLFQSQVSVQLQRYYLVRVGASLLTENCCIQTSSCHSWRCTPLPSVNWCEAGPATLLMCTNTVWWKDKYQLIKAETLQEGCRVLLSSCQ